MGKYITLRESIAVLVLIPMVLFSSCWKKNLSTIDTSETQTIVPTNTSTPFPEPISTMAPTLTEPPPVPYVTQCVSLLDELPEIAALEGKIIVHDQYSGAGSDIYDFSTDSRINLNAWFRTIVISPDKQMVAYLDDSMQKLIVSDIDGNMVGSFWTDPVNEAQGLFPVQWLDNQHILMFARGTGENPNYLAPYSAIFDLELGASEKIPMDFPGLTFKYNQHGSKWHLSYVAGDSRIAVSPDMEYILYPVIEGTQGYLVIWDRELEEEVARFPGNHPSHTVPRWSPNGEQITIMARQNRGDELFLLDRYGNAEKITDFEAESPGFISRFSWSPDGQAIAFWMDLFDAEERHPFGGRLFVIDLETNAVIDYCVEGTREIFWSLDGKYLFINSFVEGGRGDEFTVTVVNKEDLWAVDLVEYAIVLGVVNEE